VSRINENGGVREEMSEYDVDQGMKKSLYVYRTAYYILLVKKARQDGLLDVCSGLRWNLLQDSKYPQIEYVDLFMRVGRFYCVVCPLPLMRPMLYAVYL